MIKKSMGGMKLYDKNRNTYKMYYKMLCLTHDNVRYLKTGCAQIAFKCYLWVHFYKIPTTLVVVNKIFFLSGFRDTAAGFSGW